MAKEYQCARCDYVSSTQEGMEAHIDAAHGSIGTAMYTVTSSAGPNNNKQLAGKKVLGTIAIAVRGIREGVWALYFTSDEIIAAKIVSPENFKKDTAIGFAKSLPYAAAGYAAGVGIYASKLKKVSGVVPQYIVYAKTLAGKDPKELLALDAANFAVPYSRIKSLTLNRGKLFGTTLSIVTDSSTDKFTLTNKVGGLDDDGFQESLKVLKSFLPDKLHV